MFLLPGLGCPNFCRMTDQAFDSQLFHEVHKPLHRSRGFDAHSHRAWKRGIKLPHVVAFVLQSHAHYFPRFGVQHCHCLLASVQITSYNSHLGLLRSEHCRVNTEQFTRAVARPASLWHQWILTLEPERQKNRQIAARHESSEEKSSHPSLKLLVALTVQRRNELLSSKRAE